MKRIALTLTVASLLATPVVLAQSAPPAVPPPSASTPNIWFRDVESYEVLLRHSAVPTGSFEDSTSTEPGPVAPSNVTGSFEGGDSAE